jgi:hypothetical protein
MVLDYKALGCRALDYTGLDNMAIVGMDCIQVAVENMDFVFRMDYAELDDKDYGY